MTIPHAEIPYWHRVSQGKDTYIDPQAYIRRPHLVKVGAHTAIDYGVYITCNATIGDYCHIASYVCITGGELGIFEMGDFCTIASGSKIVTAGDEHLGEGLVGPTIPDRYKDRQIIERVVMGDFSSIATDSIVLQGVTMAEGSVLGANSLLMEDTEPWTIYVGSPAKPIKTRRRDRMLEYAKELRGG